MGGIRLKSSQDPIGAALWQKIEQTMAKYSITNTTVGKDLLTVAEDYPQYGNSVLRKVRIGQGSFRLSVIDAYEKRCAITGEKTLLVLEAAHIKPFSESGPNYTANGLLLRSDMHKLFDNGYITINPEFKIEVSNRIKEEFNNGKEYYQYHGKELLNLPRLDADKPSLLYLEYHNNTVFRS